MTQLKEGVNQLGAISTETEGIKTVLTLIDNTIDTASGETFLPTGELLDITKELMNYRSHLCVKNHAAEATLKLCFRRLYKASVVLRQMTDDCALAEANELSMQGMY